MDLKDLFYNNNYRTSTLISKTNVEFLVFKSVDFFQFAR